MRIVVQSFEKILASQTGETIHLWETRSQPRSTAKQGSSPMRFGTFLLISNRWCGHWCHAPTFLRIDLKCVCVCVNIVSVGFVPSNALPCRLQESKNSRSDLFQSKLQAEKVSFLQNHCPATASWKRPFLYKTARVLKRKLWMFKANELKLAAASMLTWGTGPTGRQP